MARSFPALGFDPAEGEVSSVQELLINLAQVQTMLAAVGPRLSEAIKIADDWDGSAAEEFSDHGDDLPLGIDKGAESMTKASTALATWGGQMKANQDKADDLEAKAKKLKKQLKAAEAAQDAAASAIPHDTTRRDYDDKYQAFLNTVDEAGDLRAQLEAVIADAERLKSKHLREANQAAEGLKSGPDDVFGVENDGWFVQTLDGIGKTSGIVSSAAALVAAGSLLIPGVGLVVAPIAGTVAAGAGGINALTGLAQKAAGSRNAPHWIDIGLGLVPGRTVTSGAVGLGKGLLDDVAENSTRLRTAGAGARDGVKDGFTSAGLGQAAKNIKELRDATRTTGSLKEALREKGAKDLRDKGDDLAKRFQDPEKFTPAQRDAFGRLRSTGDAFSAAVDTTVKSATAAGVELTPAQRRELELLKLAGNPGRGAAENAVINTTAVTAKEHNP
ncbi:hypothetical protein [Actinokineospora sp.]|uniref:hypothetical protein n=1 Tax=Actinokineospora sp. TaxID=1872133 RepID=UPI004037D582